MYLRSGEGASIRLLQQCDGSRRTVTSALKCGCNPAILQILFHTINTCMNLSSTNDMYSPIVFGS